MTRHDLRDRAFKLVFQSGFFEKEDMDDQATLYFKDRNTLDDDMAEPTAEEEKSIRAKFDAVMERVEEIDKLINDNTTGWEISRMGRVEVAALRLGVYELCFDDTIPTGVAINEAVELAKTYGQETSGGFVNAVMTNVQKAQGIPVEKK